MRGLELVAFDMAGTTVDEGDQVYRALEDALSANGIAFAEGDLRGWMGASKREVVGHFVEQHRARSGGERADDAARALVRRAYSDFGEALRRRYANGGAVRPMPGAEETFVRLQKRGVKVALTTGFDREVTVSLLGRLGWREGGGFVDAVVCGDDVPRGRPAPYMVFRAMEATGVLDVGRVAVVGDTALDLRAGANAGAGLVVGVLSGSQGPELLGAERHTHLLRGVRELPTLVEREELLQRGGRPPDAL